MKFIIYIYIYSSFLSLKIQYHGLGSWQSGGAEPQQKVRDASRHGADGRGVSVKSGDSSVTAFRDEADVLEQAGQRGLVRKAAEARGIPQQGYDVEEEGVGGKTVAPEAAGAGFLSTLNDKFQQLKSLGLLGAQVVGTASKARPDYNHIQLTDDQLQHFQKYVNTNIVISLGILVTCIYCAMNIFLTFYCSGC